MIKKRSQALIWGAAGDGGIEETYAYFPQIGFLLFLKLVFSSVLGQEKDEYVLLIDF